ncbi:MAG: hypothetical protein H8D88_01050 [Bacteroidetes bacterium]|nr:hypothetical protein [Bacteroidota bacterium]
MVVSNAFVHITWYEWVVISALGIFLTSSLIHIIRLVKPSKIPDYAPPAGEVRPAILYAFTGAMNPSKKESACLHFPTYIAGIIYHLGTFLSIILFFLIWMNVAFSIVPLIIITAMLAVSVVCGSGMFYKRIINHNLRSLSNPDDYLSNTLVTAFQAGTLLILYIPMVKPAYFLLAAVLLLYFPVGKLKHAIYFFAARFHLGSFFGWRGIWPPNYKTEH